jgi:hypothetical protein
LADKDGCVELLLADRRVDVNRAHVTGQTPLISACMQLMNAIDQIGAPELPTRCLVLILKSRRISDYYMKESIALMRQQLMPTPRQIATAEAGGKPLQPKHKMALLIMPVPAGNSRKPSIKSARRSLPPAASSSCSSRGAFPTTT